MKVRNKRSTAVDLAPAGQNPQRVEPGEIVEVDDEVGRSLLEQSDRWEPAQESKKAATSGKEA